MNYATLAKVSQQLKELHNKYEQKREGIFSDNGTSSDEYYMAYWENWLEERAAKEAEAK